MSEGIGKVMVWISIQRVIALSRDRHKLTSNAKVKSCSHVVQIMRSKECKIVQVGHLYADWYGDDE